MPHATATATSDADSDAPAAAPAPASSQATDTLPPPTLVERCGNFFFRYRNALFPLILIPLLVLLPPVWLDGHESWDYGLDALGVLIGLSGQVLRALVIGYAYVKRGGKKKRVYADHLVTAGFFNHCRNPLYVGNLLVLLGLIVIHDNPWLYVVCVPFFTFAYVSIVAAEERYLRAKFGEEYDAYCRRVNRWLPDFRGLSTSLESMRFNWARLIIKEYGTIAVFCGSTLLLLAYETLTHFSYAQRGIYLDTLWGLLGLVVVGWGVARYLKKSERLRDTSQ